MRIIYLLSLLFICCMNKETTNSVKAPIAQKIPKKLSIHGDERTRRNGGSNTAQKSRLTASHLTREYILKRWEIPPSKHSAVTNLLLAATIY